MKVSIKAAILASAIVITGCQMTPAEKAEHYSKISKVCGYDVTKLKRKLLFGTGISVQCLDIQYGRFFKSNVSVFRGHDGKEHIHEQRIYSNVIKNTYKLPSYIYIQNGIVTSYQM